LNIASRVIFSRCGWLAHFLLGEPHKAAYHRARFY